MDKKIVFLDVDGTISLPGHLISKKNKEAIDQARKNGHQVYICTGRARCSVEESLGDTQIDGVICSAGGYAEVQGTPIHSAYVENQRIQDTIELLKQHQIEYTLESSTCTYMSPYIADAFLGDTPTLSQQQRAVELKKIADSFNGVPITLWNGEPIHKLSFGTRNLEGLEIVRKQLGEDFTFVEHSVFCNESVIGEISLHDISKAVGVKAVLKHIQASTKNTIAVGDSMNDYPMLQTVEYGVAMSHAPKELKEIAQKIAGEPDKDAIYHLFVELNLI